MTGVVFQWIPQRGYGFLLAEDGRRYFLHIKGWSEPQGVPIVGRKVEFELEPGRNGNPSQATRARYQTEVQAGLSALDKVGA